MDDDTGPPHSHETRVQVPVVIKPGQTTRVILQPGWTPKRSYSAGELVQVPNGYAVGWRADLSGLESWSKP